MIELKEVIFGTFLENPYLRFLFIILLFYIFSKILAVVILTNIKKLTKKTKTKTDDIILKTINKPIVYFITIIGTKIAINVLPFSEKVLSNSQNILNSIIIIVLIVFIMKIANFFINTWGKKWAQKTDSSLDDELLPLIHKASNVIIIVIGAFFLLGEWNIDVTGLLAGVGIAGLALGFAIKDSLANVFGGISIILDKAIKVNDIVKLENGRMGVITDVGLRSTKMRTFNNELLIIPNGQMANSIIQNYKKPDLSVRIEVPFGVEYGSNPDKVKKVVKDTLNSIKTITKKNPNKPIQILFIKMGDSALEFIARFWVKDLKNKVAAEEEAVTKIYKNLNKSKIGIPFPTRTVYLKK